MTSMNGLLLAGDIYIDRKNADGSTSGLIGPLNTTQLALNTPSEAVDRTSKKKASYGQSLNTVTIAQPTEVSIAFDDQPAELLAMALMGDIEAINQGAGSVVDVDVTVPGNGKWTKLAHGNIAEAGISAKESDGVTAIAEAAYEIHYALGMIRAVPGGALAGVDTAIKLSYSHEAISGSRIKGATQPTIRARILLDGTNLATGKAVQLDLPEASLAPTEAVDLMAAEYVTTTLAGKAVLKAGETAPFYLDQHD